MTSHLAAVKAKPLRWWALRPQPWPRLAGRRRWI